MAFLADFHIHSRYSLATSKELTPESLEYRAKLKGIEVVGTGDCVHPGWLDELEEKLEPDGAGLLRLKKEFRPDRSRSACPNLMDRQAGFILTGEISSIYKKDGRVRKVHNLCVFPDFVAARKVQARLSRVGNIASDGRPILGLDCRDLLEMVLESSPEAFLIPAHIWTPWFSLLGSKSGFDRVEECFGDLSRYIFAMETGLSSDPPMNRACSFLDSYRLVSNSDAHSPEKLGREANIFDTGLSYSEIYKALKTGTGFSGTIEFFPQEGKYHYDGHRKCGICWDPLETLKHGLLCPVCGKEVTRGVMYRVAELADRTGYDEALYRDRFYSLTSLTDLLSEIMGKGGSTKTVQSEYYRLLDNLGPELPLLLFGGIEEIGRVGGEALSEGIRRLRSAQVHIEEGYDGEFGHIRVFSPTEIKRLRGGNLFSTTGAQATGQAVEDTKNPPQVSLPFDITAFQCLYRQEGRLLQEEAPLEGESRTFTAEQEEALAFSEGVCMVLAGPGSGKTSLLTKRIVRLIAEGGVPGGQILAVTFTNEAAQEMAQRVRALASDAGVWICTFHALGLSIVRDCHDLLGRTEHFTLIDPDERVEYVETLIAQGTEGIPKSARKALKCIEEGKLTGCPDNKETAALVDAYNRLLAAHDAFDLDDLISVPVQLFRTRPDVLERYRNRLRWILVDEIQDIDARQYELLRLLAGEGNPNLFAIGDPDQAIYGFRGSQAGIVELLAKEYPLMKTIQLTRSYRCPGPILSAAGQVLGRSGTPQGRAGMQPLKIEVRETASHTREADFIASQIEAMMGGVRSLSLHNTISDGNPYEGIGSFSDFAILCRTAGQFPSIVEALGRHGVPCQIVGSKPFYRQEPLKGLLRGLKTTFSPAIGQGRRRWPQDSIATVLAEALAGLEEVGEEGKRLLGIGEKYGGDWTGFFRDLSLRRAEDDFDPRVERVALMTLHASKGLEFTAVFISGCEAGFLPFELFGTKSGQELAEEERLFYVAITRTKKYLFLTHAKKRLYKGRLLEQKRSPFLDRLDTHLLRCGAIEEVPWEQNAQLKLF